VLLSVPGVVAVLMPAVTIYLVSNWGTFGN
jgi:hypothetical protein